MFLVLKNTFFSMSEGETIKKLSNNNFKAKSGLV